MERKELRVNMRKTKFLVSGVGHGVLKKSDKYPCAVSCCGVGNNSIQYSHCMLWVHNRCSGITKRLVADPNYVCCRCNGEVRPIDGRTVTNLKWMSTAPCLLWSLPRWCIGDMMCSGECCDSAIVARCCMAWGKFRKLLPVLTAWPLSPRIRGRCTRHVFTLLSSTAAKRRDQITLNCSDSAAMTLSWPAGFVSLKTETKHPQLHYYRNMTLRILRLSFTVSHSDGMDMYSGPGPVSILSQTFWFLVLDSKEGLWRRGLDVWRLIQVFVAWLTLAHKTEMHGEPVFDMAWCCQSHGDTEWDTDSTLI